MNEYISFLHFSDIHFNKFSGDQWDPDKDLRNEIYRDIKENAKGVINKPERILVCGDIAFSGADKEYAAAIEFLQEVCKILDIPETSVLCVPGNHDVDQNVTRNSQAFTDLQSVIENAADLDQKLALYFRDPTYNSLLFSHIHAYNSKFAGKFTGKFSHNIIINQDKKQWVEDFTLNDNSILRVHSLNSTIISNHTDTDHRLMVVGDYQIPQSEEGVAHVCLCHHPPECWKDSDAMKRKLDDRFRVQLYGHKHVQVAKKIDNSLVVGSGATHPFRSDKNWKPRYNWLSFCVDGTGDNRYLKVRNYPRVLDDNNSHFIVDTNNCKGKDFSEYSLKLERWGGGKVEKPEEVHVVKEEPTAIVQDVDNSEKINNPIRTLIYRFLELSFVRRSLILSELNLIDEKDEGMEHINLIDKIVQKAKETNSLAAMWEKVNAAHNNGFYANNPFK